MQDDEFVPSPLDSASVLEADADGAEPDGLEEVARRTPPVEPDGSELGVEVVLAGAVPLVNLA